jgi:hypothetical protein
MTLRELQDGVDRTPDLFVGYELDPGGIKYILDEMIEAINRLDFQRGLELAKEARAAQQNALAKQIAWDQAKTSDKLAREGANELDDQIDQTLSKLLQGLRTFAGFPEGNDKRRIAQEMIDEYFPQGVFPITSKKFINQHAHVEKLVGELQDEHTQDLERLAMVELVDELAELNEEFGERLNPQNDVSYDEVRAARAEAESTFFRFFAAVVGEYGDDMETLNEVLRPYVEVNNRIRRHMSRGGTQGKVDPDSGEPVESNGGESSGGGEAPNDGGSPTDGESTSDGESPTDGDSSGDGGSSTDGGSSNNDGGSSNNGETPTDEQG